MGLSDLRHAAAKFSPSHEIRNPHVESPVSEQTRSGATPSSVAILVTNESSPQVLLTRRHRGIRFGGHLCFPGGRAEVDEDVIETALRETEEEMGLDRSNIEVLGSFGHYFTQAGFRIDPMVGLIEPNLTFAPDPAEVDEVHWISFDDMLNPDSYQLTIMNEQRAYFGFDTPEIHIGGPTVSLMIGLLEWCGHYASTDDL